MTIKSQSVYVYTYIYICICSYKHTYAYISDLQDKYMICFLLSLQCPVTHTECPLTPPGSIPFGSQIPQKPHWPRDHLSANVRGGAIHLAAWKAKLQSHQIRSLLFLGATLVVSDQKNPKVGCWSIFCVKCFEPLYQRKQLVFWCPKVVAWKFWVSSPLFSGHLGGVLAAEGTTTMGTPTTVGVNDDPQGTSS